MANAMVTISSALVRAFQRQVHSTYEALFSEDGAAEDELPDRYGSSPVIEVEVDTDDDALKCHVMSCNVL